jgi:hypothetical protein
MRRRTDEADVAFALVLKETPWALRLLEHVGGTLRNLSHIKAFAVGGEY